jgi:anti-anti-sigma factor
MQFKIVKKGNHTLISVLTEKLDTNNSPDLKSQLVYINGLGEKNFILDLSKCRYCDSSGLSTVLVANRLCENAIGACIIVGLQPEVKNC